ncbi:MAG: hypothetical protein HFH68_02105 [Lachnospiraceae bacterium]|nr:hypothetical protein [Lachnospiraceae bacterium]
MDLKRIRRPVSIILLFSIIAGLAGTVPVKAEMYSAGNGIIEIKAVPDKPGTGIPTEEAVINSCGSTDKQEVASLLEQKKFTVSSPDVDMDIYEKGNGVLIKGNNSDITGSRFKFEEEIDFGTQSPDYIVVDAVANKKKNMELLFYLDDEKEHFASVKLNPIKRKNYWDYTRNTSSHINGRKITGKHKVSFKAVTDDINTVKFLFRYMFFMNNDIPVLDFDIDESKGSIVEMNGDNEHNTECYGKVSLEIPEGYKSEYTNKEPAQGTYDLEYIRGGGNSEWYSNKKPYNFELASSTKLLGMGEHKNWILLTNYYDVSMIRNKFTYWLGSEMGMKYTPKCVFTDVIMNDEYLGSYYLCEQICVGRNRVNIDNLEADESAKNITTGSAITGGYLLGMSFYIDDENMKQAFSTEMGNRYVIYSPMFDDYFNEAQYNYISQYMQKTEAAIYGEDFKDGDGRHYSEYMDINSAADYYWVQEISDNSNAYSSSTYLYKERDGKLFWGPLWDFDYVAWGNIDKNTDGFNKTNSTWFERLMLDKTFVEKLIARWPVFKEKLLYACKDGGQIDQYAEQLYDSQKANYNINNMFDNFMYNDMPAGGTETDEYIEKTFKSEVERLKKWIYERTEWIDKNIESIYPVIYKITYMSDGNVYNEDTYVKNNRRGVLFPEPPVKKGYVFKGWYTKQENGGQEQEVLFSEGTSVNEDTVFYARWVKESDITKAEKIVFAQDEVYCYVHDIIPSMPVYTIPFNSEVHDIVYTSSNEDSANIAKNEETGNYQLYTFNKGDATITASTKDGMEATCIIHVIDYGDDIRTDETPEFSLDKETITLDNGSYARIIPKYSAKNPVYLSFSFYSSDSGIVEVNEAGYVYGKKAGTAYIGVTCSRTNGIKFCKVIVKDNKTKKQKK